MSNQSLIQKIWPHAAAIVCFILMAVVYFLPQLQNKTLVQGDRVSYLGMSNEIHEYNKSHDDEALWTNSMFSGMPSYQIHVPQPNNVAQYLVSAMSLGFDRPIGQFLIGMLGAYILLISLGVRPLLAGAFSICMAFGLNNLILLEAGHMTKVTSLMTIPLIIGGTIIAYRKSLWLGTALFIPGMIMHLYANHYQMTYYLVISMVIFVLLQLYHSVKQGEVVKFATASALLLLGVFLAAGTSASKLMTTYEYSKETMRGEPILKNNTDETSSSTVDGLAWDYAMQWSNGWRDLLPSFIPMAVGGGSSEMIQPKSELGRQLRLSKPQPLGTYWGSLPFTSGPTYFGMVIFFLFWLGVLIYKGPVKWWLLATFVITALLSLGKNFEIFNRLVFDILPMYNKFRTPNSILSVTTIILPILSVLTINKLLDSESKEAYLKPLYIVGGIFTLFILIFGIMGGLFFDFSSPGDVRYEQFGIDVGLLENHRASLLFNSSLRSLIFLLLSVGLIWLYLKDKIKAIILGLGLSVLAIVDILPIDWHYLNHDDYVAMRQFDRYFAPRQVDNQILQDKDPHFRVLDLTVNTFNSSSTSYHHSTIGGYHAAKLQRYQDIIDYHLMKNNMNVFDMLNTKYIINEGQAKEEVVRINPSHLGNAWFVNKIKIVDTPEEEIESLNNFDPRGEAIVHKEFQDQITTDTLSKSGSIELTKYSPNVLEYASQSSTDQFAVFSEVWYGPDKGWKAYIDDQEVPLIRANYILRALQIPEGNHKVKMVFAPESYASGNMIALISSIISMLLVAVFLFLYYRKQKTEQV